MTQDIIAYLIITLAFSSFFYHILRFFNLFGKKRVSSSKCAGCTSGCEMKEIRQPGKSYDQIKMSL